MNTINEITLPKIENVVIMLNYIGKKLIYSEIF